MSEKRPRVMIDGSPPESLRKLLQPVELVPWQQRPSEELHDVVAIFTYQHPPVDGELMDALPNCKVISNHGVGVDHIDLAAATARNLPVGHTPDVLSGAVADLAIGLMLAAARRLPESVQLAAAPDTLVFDQSKMNGWDMYGATLGVLGLGRIGEQIARRAVGFQMPTLYRNRNQRTELEASLDLTYVSFDQLLAESDFLVIATPLNEETRKMIGLEQLRAMKPSAVLVNIARGDIVDTDAIVTALEEGAIRAAALDVTEPEPLPRDHPLLQLPNAIVTSHIGSATQQTRQKMAELASENLMLGLEGLPLRRQANRDLSPE